MLHPKADNATPLQQNCQTMLKTDKCTRTSTMGKKNETQLNSSGGSEVNVSPRQEFYRPRQVAELLGISLRTYYTMVSRGKLHPVKLSERVTVVARKEILSMIEAALGETLSQSIFSKDKGWLSQIKRSPDSVIDISHIVELAEDAKSKVHKAIDKFKRELHGKEYSEDSQRALSILYSYYNYFDRLTRVIDRKGLYLSNHPFLIIYGEAGCGKSHMFADT